MKLCILFSIRSGSHWLASVLGKNGIEPGYEILYQMRPGGRGEAKEDFPVHFQNLESWRQLKDAVQVVFDQYSVDGKMSFNISRAWVLSVLEFFNLPNNQLSIAMVLRHIFPDYHMIHLTRKNQIAQNISAYFAAGISNATPKKDFTEGDTPPFYYESIQRDYLKRYNVRFMGLDDVAPYLNVAYSVTYEELVDDIPNHLAEMGRAIDYPLTYQGTEINRHDRYEKQELGISFIHEVRRKLYHNDTVPPEVQRVIDHFDRDM